MKNEPVKAGFWCPMCSKVSQSMGAISPWISPLGVVVCLYGLCSDCYSLFKSSKEEQRSRLADKIERNLMRKYPEIKDRLPKGYCPSQPSDN